jgi:phosphoribosylformimino-5-aminoimidazole carboxamide ribotide isomerase
MKDIENLLVVRHSGISGVITGKAIYSGSLNLKEAITFVKMNDNQCSR